MTLFWLSFCDATRPRGTQFLGAALVHAGSFVEAVTQAHVLGCNPGGEVLGHVVPVELAPRVAGEWIGRLLTRAECEALDDLLDDDCAMS